mmetsp:Transcript_34961/g.64385  ORF Transcript_34961/g.64385 Transcript_34961/m.64385 type:complete len:222 (-) Transcript_34961:59-724(-)
MVSSAIPWGDTANNFLALNTIFAFKAMENELTGPVPQFLGDLPNIQGVGLGKNKLTGEIPPHIFDPPGLLGVALEGNVISGTLPSINSKSLLGLSLHSNRLVGTVPASLGENCSNLMFVDLANNQLNGTLPSSFQKLESLYWLSLMKNDLSGDLTSFCGSLIIQADCKGPKPEVTCNCCVCCRDEDKFCGTYIDIITMVWDCRYDPDNCPFGFAFDEFYFR